MQIDKDTIRRRQPGRPPPTRQSALHVVVSVLLHRLSRRLRGRRVRPLPAGSPHLPPDRLRHRPRPRLRRPSLPHRRPRRSRPRRSNRCQQRLQHPPMAGRRRSDTWTVTASGRHRGHPAADLPVPSPRHRSPRSLRRSEPVRIPAGDPLSTTTGRHRSRPASWPTASSEPSWPSGHVPSGSGRPAGRGGEA